MNYRRLGKSGIKLSEIGLGSWLTYGRGVNEETSRLCLRRAFELGVNFFDTADVYHKGAAETVYGRELGAFPRREIAIATKCFFPMSDAVLNRGLSRKHIFESVHDSLERLGTDYIDLMQCHRNDPDVEMFEIVRAFDDLIRQGKVLYWGVSEWPAARIRQACEVAHAIGAHPPVSEQPEYSIVARRVETNGVQSACGQHGLGMVIWSPLRQGLLSGKYAAGTPRDSRAANDAMNLFLREIDQPLVQRIERLRPIAQRGGMTMAQLAIRWLLERPAVTSVIIGATRVAQVEENVAAAEKSLAGEDLRAVDQLFPAQEYPG